MRRWRWRCHAQRYSLLLLAPLGRPRERRRLGLLAGLFGFGLRRHLVVVVPLLGVLRAEGQLVAHVKHWDAALRVVCKLGGAVLKQELVYVVHYVLCTVPRVRKSRLCAEHTFIPVAAGTLLHSSRLRPCAGGAVPHEDLGCSIGAKFGCARQMPDQSILPLQGGSCCCLPFAQHLVALAQLCPQSADAEGAHASHR